MIQMNVRIAGTYIHYVGVFQFKAPDRQAKAFVIFFSVAPGKGICIPRGMIRINFPFELHFSRFRHSPNRLKLQNNSQASIDELFIFFKNQTPPGCLFFSRAFVPVPVIFNCPYFQDFALDIQEVLNLL